MCSNKRVGVDAELGHDERRSVLHQTGNEMHVVRQAIKLCDDDRAAVIDPARGLERGGELGRRASASAPLPVSASAKLSTIRKPS
jgi:hypothetical protein